jgi:dihydropteroate synthase
MDEVYKYVMENFGLFHHFDSTVIDYGKGKKRPVTIKSSCGDFFTKKEEINPGDVVWKKWKNVKIPFLFDKDESKEIVEFFDNRAVINYDIISSAFYF